MPFSHSGRRQWTFDFSKRLLFPIHHIRAVTAAGGSLFASPAAATALATDAVGASLGVLATEVSGFVLTVVTSAAAESVFAEVDSSEFTEDFA